MLQEFLKGRDDRVCSPANKLLERALTSYLVKNEVGNELHVKLGTSCKDLSLCRRVLLPCHLRRPRPRVELQVIAPVVPSPIANISDEVM